MITADTLKAVILRITIGVVIATVPLRLSVHEDGGLFFTAPYAAAESGSGRDGDGRDDDDDRDDRDDRDDDDDRDDRDDRNDRDDDDDDSSGSGRSGDDRSSSNSGTNSSTTQTNRSPSTSNRSSGQSQQALQDLYLRYSNGWQESVRNGRYTLIDPEGRTVSDRRATADDLQRMRAAAGL